MNSDTPIIFADGTDFYNQLAKEYICHSHGLFIMAPSGSGKTYFVEHQAQKHWIDGDYLWPATGADLSDDSWNNDPRSVAEINLRCDVITYQAKKLGFWIVGSSNASLQPDAIVLPLWDIHKTYIQQREKTNNQHGATSHEYEAVLKHRQILESWKEKGVPFFDSVDVAAENITKHA